MASSRAAVLVFGDATDDFYECLDHLFERSARRPWLRQFIQDVTAVVKREFESFSQFERQIIGEFDSLVDLFRKLRRDEELVSHVRIVLVYITRAALVLE